MHKVALFNGKIVDVDEANLSALSSAALYGRGVFTTIAIYEGKPFLFDKHLRRLRANADAIGLTGADDEIDKLEGRINRLIDQNSISDGRARITLFDGSASQIWSDKTGDKVETLIITADQKQIAAESKLTVSTYAVNSRSPLVGVKSCNYLENILAFDEAKERGYNEAIRSNERGEVTTACMANVFWLKRDHLFTPGLSTGCLAGTTREYVLEKFECREVATTIDELLTADSIFLTSAGIGVLQAAKLDEREFAELDHPLLDLLPSSQKKTRMSAK